MGVPKTIGMIKGGQLARMMLQPCHNLGLRSAVMDEDSQAPAASLCHSFIKGDCLNEEDVLSFGRSVDVLTFEFENVSLPALKILVDEGRTVYPGPHVLELIQDKIRQKRFLRDKGFPTTPFMTVKSRDEISGKVKTWPKFQKMATSGYDGRGVRRLNSEEDLPDAFDGPSILEDVIDFEKELAIIVARSPSGAMTVFPLVEMVFHPEAHLLDYLLSPARVPPDTHKQARQLALSLAEQLDHVGVLAIEFFWERSGRLLVNEMAPRPHNSGHHTIETSPASQFEQHIRAILDWPLGSVERIRTAAMINIIGAEGAEGKARYSGLEEVFATPHAHWHCYGKTVTRPFRKMGHVTVCHPESKRALSLAQKLKEKVRVHV